MFVSEEPVTLMKASMFWMPSSRRRSRSLPSPLMMRVDFSLSVSWMHFSRSFSMILTL